MPDAGAAAVSTAGRADARPAPRPLTHGLLAAAVVSLAAAVLVLGPLGGWSYYTTPLAVRGYAPAHRMLRPSGTAGHALGIAGFALMGATLLYTLRKKSKRLAKAGPLKSWLELHIFCGVAGPVLVTLHTSFKWGGIISVAYWAMVLVVLSGFVGRYLYVRIPRTLRGTELSLADLEERAGSLTDALSHAGLGAPELAAIEAFQRRELEERPTALHLLLGERPFRRRLAALRRELGAHAHTSAEALEPVFALAAERAQLLRRIAYLGTTRKLFELWHVFHQPLVYVSFAIAALHVAVAVYLGYSFFGS